MVLVVKMNVLCTSDVEASLCVSTENQSVATIVLLPLTARSDCLDMYCLRYSLRPKQVINIHVENRWLFPLSVVNVTPTNKNEVWFATLALLDI